MQNLQSQIWLLILAGRNFKQAGSTDYTDMVPHAMHVAAAAVSGTIYMIMSKHRSFLGLAECISTLQDAYGPER